jgi:hypothetical protein
MATSKVQVKFTIESCVVDAFKLRCSDKGISMASVICEWMKTGRPTTSLVLESQTRSLRKKSVMEIIDLLEDIAQNEEDYRDAIPEQFQSRYEVANQACELLNEAISCLQDAYL